MFSGYLSMECRTLVIRSLLMLLNQGSFAITSSPCCSVFLVCPLPKARFGNKMEDKLVAVGGS